MIIEIVEQLHLVRVPSDALVRAGDVLFVQQRAVVHGRYRLPVQSPQMPEIAMQKAGVHRRFAHLQIDLRVVVDVAHTHLVAYAEAAQCDVRSAESGIDTVIHQRITGQHVHRLVQQADLLEMRRVVVVAVQIGQLATFAVVLCEHFYTWVVGSGDLVLMGEKGEEGNLRIINHPPGRIKFDERLVLFSALSFRQRLGRLVNWKSTY